MSLGVAVPRAAVVVAGGLTAIATGRLLASADRGLDFTDEGMYLLSARAVDPEASFHNAFGRYTGIVLDAVGGDIVRFRQAGVVLLLLAGLLLGERLAVNLGRATSHEPTPWIRAASAIAVAAAALHYFTLHLLTPSYNWLNLIGTSLALVGIMEMATQAQPDEPPSMTRRWFGPSVFALGVLVATMGKISSGPALVALATVALLLLRTGSVLTRLRALLDALPAAAVLVTLHALFVNSWSVTIDQIRRGTNALLVLDPDYTTRAQLRSVRDAMQTIIGDGALRFGLVLVPLLGLAWWTRRTGRASPLPIGPVVTIAVLAAGGLLWVQDLWRGGVGGYGVLTWVGVGFLLVSAAAFVASAAHRSRPDLATRPTLVFAGCLAAGTGGYAIGSNNGFFEQMNGGTMFLVAAAAALLVASVPGDGLPVAALALVVGIGANTMIGDTFADPYRQPALAEQTTPIEIADSTIRVDDATAGFLYDLEVAAMTNGWTEHTPLLDLSPYAATTLLALDAAAPPTILPSVGGYAGQQDLAESAFDEIIERGLTDEWRSAWLLIESSGSGAGGRNIDPSVLQRLDRVFPDDYAHVGDFRLDLADQTLSLWRPLD